MTPNGNNRNGHGPVVTDLIFPGVTLDEGDYASLLMRLDFYQDTILGTKFDGGTPGATYIVDPDDLSAALSDLTVKSGLLPENTLYWHRSGGAERLGVYLPPTVWPVSVRGDKRTWHVPLPGLVFEGRLTRYLLYAVKERRPAGPEANLYEAPVPNMSNAVCTGNVPFPTASAATIGQAVAAFFQSGFNDHLSNDKSRKYPDNVLRMWRILNRVKATQYPLDDLVSTGMTLGQLMENDR